MIFPKDWEAYIKYHLFFCSSEVSLDSRSRFDNYHFILKFIWGDKENPAFLPLNSSDDFAAGKFKHFPLHF